MKEKRILWMAMGVLAISTVAAWAADLGDRAPTLKAATWIKGEKVDLAAGKGKTVFVIEFFSTECDSCRQSIPLLTAIQKKFKDQGVVVVGITEAEAADAKSYVKKTGDDLSFTVGMDRDGEISEEYLGDIGQRQSHLCFVVDKNGTVLWHGPPRMGVESALEQIVAGKYDLEQARKIAQAPDMVNDYFDLVADKDKAAKAKDIGNQILAAAAFVPAQTTNLFAWKILTGEEVSNFNRDTRDLDLGMRAAKAAYDACEGLDPNIVDTYARAFFETGKVAEAIALEKKAIEMTTDGNLLSQFQAALEEFQKKANEKK